MFVVKMKIIEKIFVRFQMKSSQFFNFAAFLKYVKEVKISQVCDTTVLKYCNLPLHQ